MSDILSDDRNARTGALAGLADIAPPRQGNAAKDGGWMMLWPVLGAQLTGALAMRAAEGGRAPAAGSVPDRSSIDAAPAVGQSTSGNGYPNGSPMGAPPQTWGAAAQDAVPLAAVTAAGAGALTAANSVRWTQPGPPAQTGAVTSAGPLVTYVGSGSALTLPASVAIVTDVGSPISVDMLNGLIGGLDPLLQLLEQALESEVFTQTLPMLGAQLKTAFDNSIGALTAFKTLEQDIASALASLAAPTAQLIQDAINGALKQAGFPGDTATVTIDPASGSLQLSLKGSVDDPFSVATAPDLGIPGLDLKMTGTASASLDYSLNVQASVDTSGNWSLTDVGGPALTVGLNAGFSNNFSANASVGFLEATVTDPNHDTGIHGTFSLDTSGAASFTGASTIDLHLKTDLTNAILPSLSADLEAAWNFGASTVDGGADISAFGDTPMVAIDNITYDLGSFVDNFLRPILNEITPIIKPLQDALAVFNYDLMPLFQKIMGASASQLDVNGDGKITLIDFLQKADPSQDLAGLQTFINLLSTLTNFAADLQGIVAPATPFDIGSFTLGQDQDIRSTSFNIAQAIPTQTKAPDDLTGAIDGLSGVSAGSSNVANILTTLLTTQDFNAPAITDGTKAFQFLFGGTGDIFDWNLPTLNLGWGSVDANGTPIQQDQLADIVLVPGFPSIDLTLGVAFQLAAALNIGFDTSGLQKFAASNFSDPSLIGEGAFLADQVQNGASVPLLSLGGAVELGIEANAVLASIGGGGDIGGTLGISFTQPGDNYIYQLQNEMSGGNTFAPFTVSGKVTAGFDAEAKVFGQTLASWHSARVTLYSFNVSGAGPLPSATFWSSGNGDGEAKGNWSPTFGLTTLDAGGSAYYYGDATVQTKSQVTFAGPLTAEMTSLQLPAAAEVDVTSGVLYIDGSSIDSVNAGLLRVEGTGTLTLQGAVNNTGTLALGTPIPLPPAPPPPPETPSIMIAGLVNIYGGGTVKLSDSDSNVVNSTGTNALLWNSDNTISGAGTFAVQILNQGVMEADGAHWMVLAEGVSNEGTLAALDNGAVIGGALAGGLQIEANVDNSSGLIGTGPGGAILIDNGVTILGGILSTNPGADGGVIEMNGAVTFDGGATNLQINGNVHVGVGSTLTLKGLIFSKSFAASTPPAGVVASGGTVILDNATFRDGLLNALPPVIGPAGGILISGTSTLDGAGGAGVLAVDGLIQVSPGNTLVLDGTIDQDQPNAGIELSGGAIVVGNATADSATLGPDTMGNGGTLLLDDGTNSSVTGADASSLLTNNWTIQGSGTLGGGSLALINTATGTIDATGASALVVNGGEPMINAGLIGAFNGTLDLHGGVINTAGIIGAASGGTLELDGATIGGGTLRTTDSGTMFVVGSAMLDGTAGGVTLAAGSGFGVGAGTTLALTGTVENDGTIAVTGNAGTQATAAVVISGSVDLTGGGSITLADASGGGQATTQPISGDVTTATLDTDNVISGQGAIDLFALTNEATGTIDASNGILTLTAANGIINEGLLNSTPEGTLAITGGVNNAAGTIGAAGGVTQLDTALILGGVLQTSADGSIRASNGISGLASGVTVAAGAQVAVDATATLGLNGPLVNRGTLTVLGQTGTAELLLIGSVTLSGGGSVVMADGSGAGASTQAITGTSSSDTLDNTGNTIGGYGELGLASLTLINEKQGVIDAASGVLDVDTGTKTITNAALLEAASGGELDLRSNVSNPAGTIGANGGAVDLIGITVTGGLFAALPGGTIHVQGTSTLDASASAVTIAAGAPMAVDPGATLTLKGTFADNGTLSVTGDGTPANDAEVLISGPVTLGGTGTLTMAYLPGGGQIVPYLMQSVAADGTLDHVSGTISGSGGINLAGLTNEAGAVFDANGTYGGLDIGAATTIQNSGLMEATGTGAMSLDSATVNTGMIQATGASVDIDAAVANSGTILAQGGGAVSIDRGITVTNTGLVEAAPGNSAIFLSGVIAGTKSTTDILGGGRLQFVGATGTLSGGTLSNAAHGLIQIDSGIPGAELSNIAVANAGTMELLGRDSNPLVTPVASLRIDGGVTLSGGGLVTLTDDSGTDDSTSQVITGTTGGAILDNIDNTITGYGQLGAGALTLINEKAGTIEATGGTIVLDTGAVAATNKGLMEAVGGTLTVRTVLDGTGGGTVSALNNGGTASGVILLDGGTLRGGTVRTDLKDAASSVEVTANSGTLDGTAGTLTLAAGANVLVGATQSLTATGAIANFGTILVAGNPYAGAVPAELRIVGTAALSGGGLVSLADASGYFTQSTEIITGASAAATLDNVAQTISGYGELGAGTLTLINGPQGIIDATGGTLTVDTGANTTVNQGLIEAVGGMLIQRGVVDGTKGGTISALNSGRTAGVSGTVQLDGATLRGGTIVTDLKDRTSVLDVSGNGGTLDGTAGAVTIATGAQAVVGGALTMTAKGAIANFGTLGVDGNPYAGVATLLLGGDVTLTGGGLVSLADLSGYGSATTQVITGVAAAIRLDNADNLIRGYGGLGAGTLTLLNESKGTIEAIGGALTVDTGANTVINQGLMEAAGGTLTLRETVDGTSGGIVSALNNGGTASGVVLLDGGTLRGGTFSSDLKDTASALEVTSNGGTLDGTAGVVTIASGAQVTIGATFTMTAKGTIANSGTIGVVGNPYAGVAALRVSGAVTLDGGGQVSMTDASGYASATTQAIAGTASSDSLDNIDNLISGYGSLGAGTLTLANEAKGTIKATGGVLTLDTGANTVTDKGLMEAVGGTLLLSSNVANSGTTLAGTAGDVVVGAEVANTGLAEAAGGGTLTVHGTIDGAASSVKVAAGGTLVLDGGLLSGGTLTDAATGAVNIITNGGTLTNLAIVNAGSFSVIGNPYAGTNTVAHIGGTVTLSGGGAMTLVDASGYSSSVTQIVTGTKASDTLDNADNLISGYGQLGGGTLTLINEAKGTIEATGGLLVADTGTTTATNRGLLEAVGGTLDLRSVVDQTSGGAIAALNNGGTTSGVVLLDGATLLGGTISTDLKDAASIVETAGTLAATLDGSAAAITFATGARVQVNPAQTLIVKGALVNQGTLSDIGNAYAGSIAALDVSGTVTLTGGGVVSLLDISGYNTGTTQEIVGAAASSTLDNIDNLISGYGLLGAGTLGFTNELKGTIEAAGGVLTLDTGKNTAVNHGQMAAIAGTLQLNSALSNDGSITAGAGGGVVVGAALTNAGVITAASGGTLTVRGTVSGASSDITVASGGALILDGGTISGGVLHNAVNATIDVTTNSGVFDSLTIDNAGSFNVIGNPYSGVVAQKVIGGTVTLSGGGTVSLFDASGLNSSLSQGIIGATSSATLDNVDNLITGYGMLGAGRMTLVNETKGTIEAAIGTLIADTDANLIVSKGLMEAIGGTLWVASGLTNSGTVLAGALGDAIIAGAMTNTGLAEALSGGTLTVSGGISGASSTVTVAAGGTLVVDGGSLSGGTVGDAAKGAILVTTNGGTLANLALSNATMLSIIGNPYSGKVATVNIGGTVTLSGGGTLSMLDASGLNDASQEITASVAGATLDNVDNTISGYGTLGAGPLTLVNESKGTVEAVTGTLTADFTTAGMTNQGLMEANGGTLVSRGVVDGTQGGTIAALRNAVTSGIVVLDGATLRGGTIATDQKDPGSMVELTSNGGTLDGTAGAVTLATGAQILVTGAQTLTASGAIADQGTISLAGNPYSGAATELRVGGTVTLTGGGAITMSDISGLFSTSSQSITGSAASDTFDIARGRVSGFGQLGGGTLTLINEASGTIDASGGTLTVDTGANAISSQGLLTADSGGVLDLRSNVANAGVLAAEGTVTNEATLTNTGDLIADGMFSNASTVVGGATVSASGTFANLLGAVVTGTVAAFGAAATISNLGTIDGAVSLTGGDRLVTGNGAVFSGGIAGGSGANTLEIASGPYTLTNFNAPGTPNYSTLQIDAGVTLITDSSDNLSGIALNNYGAIDLTAFEANSPFQNAGQITGDVTLTSGVPLTNSAGGVISGAGLAVIEALGPASVMNAGVIDPATYGVDLMAGGTVTNVAGGTIDGTVAGVLVTGGAGTVITGGSIIGGGDAVSLPAGYANRVILHPGAAFTGLVDGGNPVGGTVASVLELGGVAGATTLSGLGSQIVDFSTVAIDSGAYALLSGANTLGAGVALSDAGVFTIKGGASLTEAAGGVVSGSLSTVDGLGSLWNAAGGLVVGGAAGAGLVVSGKGSLSAAGSLAALVLGSAAGGTGALTVTGTGSRATLTGQVNVGQSGGGLLTIANQGTAFTGGSALAPSAGLDAASAAGGAGTIAVTGTRSLLHNTGAFIVGDAGVGDLAISGGGTVITSPGTVAGLAGLVIGASAGAAGSSAEVSGAGSRLDVTGLLDVGIDGSAGLLIDGGATVTAASLDAANLATAVGEVTLSDPGTALIVSGDATVSDDGTGVLSVLNGASFSARSLTIGSQTDSSGALVVSGDNTTLTVSGELNIGTALGTGDLTVGPGAVVNASVVNLQGGVVLEGGLLDPTVYIENGGSTTGGFGTIASDYILLEGTILSNGSKSGKQTEVVQGALVGGGTATIQGSVSVNGPGILQIGTHDTIELTGAVLNAVTTTFTDNLTPTGTYTVNNSVIDVVFQDSTGVLRLDDIAGFAGTVATWKAGDSFVITGGTLSNLGVGNGDTLTFSDTGTGAGAGGIDSILFGSAINAGGFSIVNGNTVQAVACFAEGTRIRTATGDVPVEQLAAGDHAVTADGAREPIVWLGQRAVNCDAHPAPETVWPVRVRARAFGENIPVRDLYLSPDHAVFVNSVLVPVKLLIDGDSIAQVKRDRVRYFHVELPRHAVILAEGLTVESYLDTGDRANFRRDGETIRLFADFAARLRPETALLWETLGAAPLVMAGERLEAARRTVMERAPAPPRRSGSVLVKPHTNSARPLSGRRHP